MGKYALIIGISQYEDKSLARLKAPEADVRALAELLRSPDVGGFDDVTALTNRPFAEVHPAIASFFRTDKKPDDLLLLYFSGHGVLDENGRLYLALHNTRRALLSGTAIAASFISDEMDSSRSKRQVLILDCCHSGAFARGAKAATGASVGTASAFSGAGFGRVVLTATDATQYAWEGDRVIGEAENSLFTHFLIEGIRRGEADRNADGKITLDELYEYVFEKVRSVASKQTPNKFSFREQGEIVIARNPRPIPVPLPPDLQEAVEDPRPIVREAAVRQLEPLLQDENKGLALSARHSLQKLAEDDSRMVSSAARRALEQNPPTSTYQPVRPPSRIQSAAEVAPPIGETPIRSLPGRWKWGCILAALAVALLGACLCSILVPSMLEPGPTCSWGWWPDPYWGYVWDCR